VKKFEENINDEDFKKAHKKLNQQINIEIENEN
jgi:hypothetical protein